MQFRSSVMIGIALAMLGRGESAGQSWQSAILYTDQANRLVYVRDAGGNRIPDFSHAGYRNGEADLPVVPVVKTISALPGDNTAAIQAGLDQVSTLPAGPDGMRGALLLAPGAYRVNGTLYIRQSGVVLRGSGDGEDTTQNTVLVGVGDVPHQRSIIVAGGGSSTKWSNQVSGTKTDIVSDTVLVGDRTFQVANAAPFGVGDNIVIYHPCSGPWLTAIDSGGSHYTEPGAEAGVDVPWTVNSQPILYNRFITGKNGNTITIDAPVMNHLVRSLSQSYVYKYARTGIKTGIGIEDLRVDIEAAGSPTDQNGDENHAWNAVELVQVEDCWVKSCTALHFGHAGFMTRTATRVTIQGCSSVDPISVITGERRYNYDMSEASQLNLVVGCSARYGRHDYVSNGASLTSGCVFLECTSSGAYAPSEGHRRWSTGLLYDNVSFTQPNNDLLLCLYNRGHYGTSHGWAAAHSVAWNCTVGGGTLILQNPPTAQNYAIGCFGTVTGQKPPAPFGEPQGYIEGTSRPGLSPKSLYRAQLAERLRGTTGVGEQRERESQPEGTQLLQNFPNPFNPMTTIEYVLTERQHVSLRVTDTLGREVADLVETAQGPGRYAVHWDASGAASGVYLVRLTAGSRSEVKKLILQK
jgi:hypothetical protein